MPRPERILFALGALAGLLGVAASAAAAHLTGGTLATAAQFLLVHAGPVLALAGLSGSGRLRPGLARPAAACLVLGLVLFSGDLSARALAGHPLFPMAAPTGGLVLMLGWALAALAGLLRVSAPAGTSPPPPARG
ncbi:protein of unknown function DUF423 [Methylobacterium sp. 4-46]|uniref:DUF423 domain-containing protein n=1 Tax=unclassified Methylobacterium TaxID=2615210 RepID=UPI000152CE7B|nr:MULTISPECIES: DUF423 domain-containing protein [Methylobacterium]ACA19409.1 protein of unknown function DUF423 [Methylobacterium sp. 4-46]WFT78607.1 DUF423 domain-containing protein [Methylobacterium nodulans]